MREGAVHHSWQPHTNAGGGTASGADFHLTWIGPADGQCAQALERFRDSCSVQGRRARVHFETLESAALSLDSVVLERADRVVVACETRWDYPWQTIERLERLEIGVPWGVVTGAWHAGSRRTGIGLVAHWQLPWYRWWEGWYGWFFPELARSAARCRTQFDALTLPIDLAAPAESYAAGAAASSAAGTADELGCEPKRILILATCHETSQGWQLAAATANWSSLVEQPWQPDNSDEARRAAAPDCILWDDSCQDRLPGGHCELEQASRQIAQLARRYPSVPIVAGISLAHLSGWRQLQRAGAHDFIVKPSFGLPLADYLVARGLG